MSKEVWGTGLGTGQQHKMESLSRQFLHTPRANLYGVPYRTDRWEQYGENCQRVFATFYWANTDTFSTTSSVGIIQKKTYFGTDDR